MNLPVQTEHFGRWLLEVLRAFFGVAPWTTGALIGASVLGSIAHLLAFFLPLKVLILAGADHVPHYMPFISPDDQLHWITAFAAAAVAAYLLTLALGRWTQQLAERGSRAVLDRAIQLSVIGSQDTRAQRYYSEIGETAASLLFALLALLALLLLSEPLFLTLFALLYLQYWLTTWLLSGDEYSEAAGDRWGRLQRQILDDPKGLLQFYFAVNYFAGFLVLLAVFLWGGAAHFFAILLSFLLLRQLLRALSSGIRNATRLARGRGAIDPLVFPEKQRTRRESSYVRALRQLFAKPQRQQRSERVLQQALSTTAAFEVTWEDPPYAGRFQGLIARPRDSSQQQGRCYQQQIYTHRLVQLLDDEALLYQHVGRERLRGTAEIARFTEGPFLCRICEYGNGRPPSVAEWQRWEPVLLRERMAIAPPPALLRAYRGAHRLLYERLTPERLAVLQVAVDTPVEQQTLERLMAALPVLTGRLRRLPLYLYPPGMNRELAVMDASGELQVVSWGRWRLEPLGGTLTDRHLEGHVRALLPELPRWRDDVEQPPLADDVRLARWCRALEEMLEARAYKRALRIATRIVRYDQTAG
ncbi:hypothetical protein CKO15_07130 [Halorhodospira abdelmalekii]|uniref:hypothetical protein n=1 Tax=Halorhodospira abdelmalekii TaxID=421629 RepID=UPI001904D097|nr:hypothetical protein [Halorhodospira abdelmalekii]MBK1735061.1 hypothetical protein [Halorhodospira abdelmalekii]